MTETLRTARLGPGDAGALARALPGLVPAEERAGRGPSLEHLTAVLAGSANYVFLSRQGRTAVGYLCAYRFPRVESSGTQVYLFNLEVAADYRGRGIGRSLVESLLEACRADGVGLVWAGTALDNVAAQRTFEAAGGRRVSGSYVEYEFPLAQADG